MIYLFAIFFLIISFEIFFNFFYKKIYGVNYKYIKRVPIEKFIIKGHPYLPFILKKNFKTSRSEKMENLYHKNFYTSELKTNNLGFLNGKYGNRKVIIPKPKNLFRINCLGASTTGNYINFDKKNYSYPLELEKILKRKYKKKLEVNNFGQGGYNSTDILVRLNIQIVDTKPDVLILYHAFNDIRSYLTKNFESDYSHSRKNFGDVFWRYWLGSKIPNIPLNFLNYLINKILPSNHRYGLLETVSKGEFHVKNDYKKGLKVYERNIQSIIDICKCNNIKIVLCTFCFYLHERIKKSASHKIYKKIVIEENKIIKKLAKKNKVQLVDCYNLMPKNINNFVDSIHFSPNGMKKMAKIISKTI